MRDEYAGPPRRVVEAYEVVKPLEKSPGWPGILNYKTSQDFRDAYPTRTIKLWETMGREPIYSPAYAFLKDEPIAIAKIKAKDRRLILCWDDSFQVCKLRFQQEDHTMMKERWWSHESKMGWSPLLGGFHQSLKRLRPYTFKIQEDFKRYDGTIPARLMYEIYQMDWDNLRAQDKTALNEMRYYNIVHNSIYSFEIMPDGYVVRHTHGNKSGTADTTPLNAKANTFLKAYEIAKFLLDNGEIFSEDIPTFDVTRKSYYSMITYGDDRLVGENIEISPQQKEDIYAGLGMWLPKEKIKVSDEFEGLQFCGATIKRDPRTNRYYPCWGDNDKMLGAFTWSDTSVREKIASYVAFTYGGKYHKIFQQIADDVGVSVMSPQELNLLYTSGPKFSPSAEYD